ncbi:MAG TPA: hypothetical protein VNF47_03655 [Streptosporangiaceae bacterium]|nr:hypothetical protein [Streptosporangiaceae bacterium]
MHQAPGGRGTGQADQYAELPRRRTVEGRTRRYSGPGGSSDWPAAIGINADGRKVFVTGLAGAGACTTIAYQG